MLKKKCNHAMREVIREEYGIGTLYKHMRCMDCGEDLEETRPLSKFDAAFVLAVVMSRHARSI